MLITSRKLVHYFQTHPILVVTSFLIRDILHNQDATGRIAKWAVELGSFELNFKPRTAIKSQALVDFLAEWTEIQTPAADEKLEYWTMYFDGSLMVEGTGAGIVLISPTGERLKYVLQIYFPASNNAAKYEALLHGLRITISLGIRRMAVHGDSELVVNQVQKEYSCTSTKMSVIVGRSGNWRAPIPTGVFVQQLH